MEIIDWVLVNASSSVYILFPLGAALFGIYKVIRYFLPNKKEDTFGIVELAFIPIFIFGFFFIDIYANFSFMNKMEKRAAANPNERLFEVNKSVSYNPFSWLYDQVTVYHTVAPLPANPINGVAGYDFKNTSNDFYLNVAAYDNDKKTSKFSSYWLQIDCKNRVQQVNKADEQGVWRIIEREEKLETFEINRYCETNYTKEFEAFNCMQDMADNAGSVDKEARILIGQSCS